MIFDKDTLRFERVPNGRVKVSCDKDHIVLSVDEWASVVASVSKRGETAKTFRAAKSFHNEE